MVTSWKCTVFGMPIRRSMLACFHSCESMSAESIKKKRLTLLARLKSALLVHNRLLAHRKMPFERLPAAVFFVANLAVVLLS